MSHIDPEQVVRDYIYAKDNHHWDKLLSLLDPGYTSSDPSVPEPVKGKEAVSQYFPMLELVDMKTEVLKMMSKGEDVAAELAVTCYIKEENRKFTIKMAKFYHVNDRGLMDDEREYSDTAGKFKLLGDEAATGFQQMGEKVTGVHLVATPAESQSEAQSRPQSDASASELTPQSIFETRIPQNLHEAADKLAGAKGVCQFVITGPAGGAWYIDLSAHPATVIAGTHAKPDCTMTCADDEFVKIITGQANSMLAAMTGKLKIQGDMAVAGTVRMVIK